jgi:hypothetical protein
VRRRVKPVARSKDFAEATDWRLGPHDGASGGWCLENRRRPQHEDLG